MRSLKQPHFYDAATLFAVLIMLVLGCSRDEPQPPNQQPDDKRTPYSLIYPAYFPVLNIPPDNPQTYEGVKLGKMLYYDKKLSANGPQDGMSCSSCHSQPVAFSLNTTGTAILPHMNLGWSSHFLWEGKVFGSLENIMLFEVEEFFKTDPEILKQDVKYPQLYREAFGNEEITTEKTAYALAQFFRTLISADSRYDRYLKEETSLTEAELRGMQLFFSEEGDCFHCHTSPLMTDNRFHNIGLDASFSGANLGRYNFTGDRADIGLFKTPTLRNIVLTAPYMHDGRYKTLEEVLDHYSSGVKLSPTLDPIMTKPGRTHQLNLSQQQKDDLIAFLKTLTDETFLTNPEFSSPF